MAISVSGFADNDAVFSVVVEIINAEEQLLGKPFPAPVLAVERVDNVGGGFCGHNGIEYGPAFAGQPFRLEKSEVGLKVGDKCDDLIGSIAHELAHTWFHGGDEADWIDEGLANVVEQQMVEMFPDGRPVYPPISYCANYANIRELELDRPSRVNAGDFSGFTCNYTLGNGIFGDLRAHYGDAEFNRRISTLALTGVSHSPSQFTIREVREALGGDDRAREIIDLWYEGQPEMRRYRHLDAVEWTFPPTADGDYLHFAGRTTPGVVEEFVLEENRLCSNFFLKSPVRQDLMGIADPLPAGSFYQEIPEAVVVNSQINPGAGEFQVTARIYDPNIIGSGDLSLAVVARVEAESDNSCPESIRYSHLPVVPGSIPDHLKQTRHYSLDVIQWTFPPTLADGKLSFAGIGPPGAVTLTARDGYCSQIHLFHVSQWGYHLISSISPLVEGNQYWIDPFAEVTAARVNQDGSFEAEVTFRNGSLDDYDNPVLVVVSPAQASGITNRCAESEVLSVVDIR